jgi:hypothetical protein
MVLVDVVVLCFVVVFTPLLLSNTIEVLVESALSLLQLYYSNRLKILFRFH